VNSADAWLIQKEAPTPKPASEASRRAVEWIPENGSDKPKDPERPTQEAPVAPNRGEPTVKGTGHDARELADLLRSEIDTLTRRIEGLEAQLSAARSGADRAKRWAG
jgi:hypothetical protein